MSSPTHVPAAAPTLREGVRRDRSSRSSCAFVMPPSQLPPPCSIAPGLGCENPKTRTGTQIWDQRCQATNVRLASGRCRRLPPSYLTSARRTVTLARRERESTVLHHRLRWTFSILRNLCHQSLPAPSSKLPPPSLTQLGLWNEHIDPDRNGYMGPTLSREDTDARLHPSHLDHP
ncbi:hypothetical protein OH76DRAFT_185955 [Lentinus brumalis]|uniref:Uncharacterized protein n=1 Tax=Lentinus brumalis TaxID=2498619 RepID=A0A371CN36_9APHY|nr:hypothetical protein OH76DRAFT_185955 [Polyporus brumalis]